MNKIYSESSLLIRMVEHDGYSLCVQEALAHGRHVIYSYDKKFCNYATNYSEAKKHVINLMNHCQINFKGHDYVKKEFNPENVAQILEKLLS